MAYWTGSTASLAANGTWTGPARYSERFDSVAGSVFASHTGTLYIEQSSDGQNWDISASTAVAANTGAGFSETLRLPFWRLRFVNGATAQTSFRVSASAQGAGDS